LYTLFKSLDCDSGIGEAWCNRQSHRAVGRLNNGFYCSHGDRLALHLREFKDYLLDFYHLKRCYDVVFLDLYTARGASLMEKRAQLPPFLGEESAESKAFAERLVGVLHHDNGLVVANVPPDVCLKSSSVFAHLVATFPSYVNLHLKDAKENARVIVFSRRPNLDSRIRNAKMLGLSIAAPVKHQGISYQKARQMSIAIKSEHLHLLLQVILSKGTREGSS